jgi:hypothetical protein
MLKKAAANVGISAAEVQQLLLPVADELLAMNQY